MFQIAAFNPQEAAQAQIKGAFSNVTILQFNHLRNDGDGNLEVVVGGQVLKKAKSFMVTLGGYSGDTFQETRRQFWMGSWNKNQESTPPDCFSANGEAPHPEAKHKQSDNCRTCPRSQKDSTGYTPCGYTKDILLYLVEANAQGQAQLVLDTPLIWRASAMSMFGKLDQASNSAGLIAMANVLIKSGVTVFEQVVFEIGFHQSSKAPTLKVLGQMPTTEAERVIAAAAQPDTKALLEFKAPKAAGLALPAPPTAAKPALAAPAPVAAPAPAPAPAPAMAAFQMPAAPQSLVPPASPATVAAAAPPIITPQQAPAAPTANLQQLQAEIMQTIASGQPVDPGKLALLQQMMVGGAAAPAPAPAPVAPPVAAPAPAPVAQAASPSAQANALAAFTLGNAR